MIIGGGAAAWVGFRFDDLPMVIHLPFAILVGMLFGALWGGLAGLLKARTGAHEVIVTIMLNYVGYYLCLLGADQGVAARLTPGSVNPKSPPMNDSAILPKVLGDQFNLHLGFVLALVAVAIVWWLLSRSTLGYRSVPSGRTRTPPAPRASTSAATYTVVMMIAGALLGLAGVNQVLGTVTSGVSTRHRRRHRLRRHHRGAARSVPTARASSRPASCSARSRRAVSPCRPPRTSPSTWCWWSSR